MIRNLLVVGGGTMGRGIAQTAAAAGCEVRLFDIQPRLAAAAPGEIESALRRAAEKGKFDTARIPETLARIRVSDRLADPAPCDLAIEAIVENLAAKRQLFRELEEALPAAAILASNTSSLRIADVTRDLHRPERALGLHFFNPVPAMPLVEIICGPATGEAVLADAREWVARLGKTPVIAADTPGFIVNRLLIPYLNDAAQAFQEGLASAEDIDTAMKLGAGHPLGPLALADLIGLDIVVDILETRAQASGNPRDLPCALLKDLVAQGRLGRKTGWGFHRYSR